VRRHKKNFTDVTHKQSTFAMATSPLGLSCAARLTGSDWPLAPRRQR